MRQTIDGYTLRPLVNAFRVIAWGRGIPSTVLAVMAACGDLEPVDAVIHADPGWEHYGTYDIGDYYTTWLQRRGLYVEVLKTGDIRQQGAYAHIHIPFWTADGGPLQRQCTRHFKLDPQKRRVRELLGFNASAPPHPLPRAVEQWIGFTMDEPERMKPSRVKFIVNRYPLIEKRMYRRDCIAYLQEKGLPLPPPSSCVGCPYKDAARWLATTPDDFAEAVEFDECNRCNPLAKRGNNTADNLYIYRYRPQHKNRGGRI